MISGQMDHPKIQVQLDALRPEERESARIVLDVESAERVQWALMFSQLCMVRMFIGFLGYNLKYDPNDNAFTLQQKGTQDWGYRPPNTKRQQDDWKGKGAEDISVEDVIGQPPLSISNSHEQELEACLLLAHKIVHLAYHQDFDKDPEDVQTRKVKAAIPAVVKLLQQCVYKPIGQSIPLPDDYRDIMDKTLPGWDA